MAKDKTLELSIKIAGKMDKSLTAALKNSQSQISSFSRGISSIGTAGLAAMGALAAGTAANIASCTKEAAKFENYMADVVKYVDGLADASGKISDKVSENGKTYAENYELMKDAIKDLSTQIPYTQEDLTRLAAAAGQSGKSLEDLIKVDGAGNITGFLRDIAMTGTAMDISADQAGEWAAKWEQAFKMSHEEVMVLFDQINYLGANSATTAAEIAEAVNSAASLGQIGGLDVATTAALADAMLATGVSSDRVGTSIKRMITNLSKGESATKAQKEMLQEMGMTAEWVAKAMQEDSVGTLNSIFTAVNNLPQERQVAALSTLFGQWAIEGGAKIAGNMDVFTKALEMVSDPSLYSGSMEREFIIKSSTPEAIETMLASTKTALQIEVGEAFLPAKKEFDLAMIDFLNSIRKNMPELGQLAERLGTLASKGIAKLGDAMDWALPYIQKGLDYLINNGDQVASILGKVAATFAAMKFAPQIEGLARGAGGLLFGSGGGSKKSGGLLGGIKSLFTGGRKAGAAGAGFASAFGGAASSNGFKATLGAAISSLLSGNGLAGTTGLLSTAAGSPGLLSGYVGAGSVIRNGLANSRVGQWLGGIGAAMGNTKTGGLLSGLLGKAGGAAGGLLGAAKSGIGGLLGKAGSSIAGSKAGIAVSGLLGKAGGLFSSIAGSGAVKAIGGAASGGLGVLSSIWGPIAGGFGSLLSGALPIVGVISSIIAVVSILGDNLEGIRSIVGSVFGEQGLAIFDKFTGALSNVGSFISGLFVDGGVAKALSGFRETLFGEGGIFAGNATAAGAFDGIVQILQSVMGVVGQVVTFANTTVKPIIESLFNFITQTVVPVILQTISAAAPYISSIISGVGSAVMTVAQIIGQAIQLAMPIIQTLATVLLHIGQVVVPAVLAAISVFAEGISSAIAGVKTIFEGVITFITGVFSGNWRQAWEGVRSIFTGIFDTLGALFKTPINAVISLINKAISGINGLGITIPDWVPLLGGKSFSINIPEIPMLAKGGFTNGASIAGEAGTEAVISFQRAVRQDNIRTWAMAGRMLGVRPTELQEIPESGGGTGSGGITFAPVINIQGNADRSVIDEALAEAQARFEAWYLQMQRKQARTAY
ncbi:MAG: phage tail tape measure protein [Eubacteriales bacterium]|nr:phage tail tape measure protein [Eubacteriales bacterium]